MGDLTTGGVLSREQIAALLDRDPPIIEGLVDRETQLQPNGVDLTLDNVSGFVGPGTMTLDNARRRLPGTEEYPFDPDQQLYLSPGPYLVRFNETINLPPDCMAYTRPRSSLLRSGVARTISSPVQENESGIRCTLAVASAEAIQRSSCEASSVSVSRLRSCSVRTSIWSSSRNPRQRNRIRRLFSESTTTDAPGMITAVDSRSSIIAGPSKVAPSGTVYRS
jgi:hypothetical protein